jgi:hypothetical protein
MLADTTGGMGAISFQHRRYGTSDSQIEWIVEYSTNGGSSWIEAGRFTAGASVATFSADVNSGANGRVRIRTSDSGTGTNRRTSIDEFSITAYSPPTSPTVSASGNLSVLNSTYGSPSLTATSFTVSGANLTQGILVDPPDGFEVSLAEDGVSGFAPTQTISGSGTIAPTSVFIRLAAGQAAGFYSGNIVCTSGSASATLSVPEGEVQRKGLNIRANDQSKIAGQTLTLGPGQTAFSATGLVGTETVGSVTISASGGTASSDPAGSYTLTPSDATGGTFSASNYLINYLTGTLTVSDAAAPTFGSWISGYPQLVGSNAMSTADPDSDGLPNLAEYYMGLDPTAWETNGPVFSNNFAVTPSTLHLTYRRARNTTGVSAAVVWIGSLANSNWSADGVSESVVEKAGYDEVTATVTNASGDAQKFLRLKITQP